MVEESELGRQGERILDMRRTVNVLSMVCLVALLGLSGCPAHFPEVNTNPAGATAVVDRSPRETVEIIRKALNTPPLDIGIASESPGMIETGWQRFPGTRRGWRVWQEQTRYVIRVIPDWEKPDARCQINVREETQERALEGHPWRPNPEVTRPERSEALVAQLRTAVMTAPPAAPATRASK
jgi:hypothetical protein